MKKRRFIRMLSLFCLLAVLLSVTACKSSETMQNADPNPSTSSAADPLPPEPSEGLSLSVTDGLRAGMTYAEVLDVLGFPLTCYTSTYHPYCFAWKLEGNKELRIVFSGEDFDAFMQKFRSGEFALPGETPTQPVFKEEEVWGISSITFFPDENGIRWVTPNEHAMLRQWDLNTVAVSACICENDKVTVVLFEP